MGAYQQFVSPMPEAQRARLKEEELDGRYGNFLADDRRRHCLYGRHHLGLAAVGVLGSKGFQASLSVRHSLRANATDARSCALILSSERCAVGALSGAVVIAPSWATLKTLPATKLVGRVDQWAAPDPFLLGVPTMPSLELSSGKLLKVTKKKLGPRVLVRERHGTAWP